MNTRQSTPSLSNGNTGLPAEPLLTADSAWESLVDCAENMLVSYKKVLEFYVKWHSLESYLAELNQHKTNRRVRAIDTLATVAAKEPLLVDLGASQRLFLAARNLEGWFSLKPKELAEKRAFAAEIAVLIDELVLIHPEQHFPADEMPNRSRLEFKFKPLQEQTTSWTVALKRDLTAFLETVAERPTENNSASTENPQLEATPRATRALMRNLFREREMQLVRHAVEDSVLPRRGRAHGHHGSWGVQHEGRISSTEAAASKVVMYDENTLDPLPVPEPAALPDVDEPDHDSPDEAEPETGGTSTPRRVLPAVLYDPHEPLPWETPRPVRRRRSGRLPTEPESHEPSPDDAPPYLFDCRGEAPPRPLTPPSVEVRLECAQHVPRGLKRSLSDADIDDLRNDTAKKQGVSPRSAC